MHKLNFLIYLPKEYLDKKIPYFNSSYCIINDWDSPQYYLTDAYKKYVTKHLKIFIGGDPIYIKNINHIFSGNEIEIDKVLQQIKGHYYLFIFDDYKNQIWLSSSLFNFCPIFYFDNEDYFVASNNIKLLKQNINNSLKINKNFIAEQILFNYPLFDDTIYNDLHLLEANCYIHKFDNKIKIYEHDILKKIYYSINIEKAIDSDIIADSFVQNARDYFPENKIAVSFTGGFDGRTLVALSKFLESDFITYSHGTHSNQDITIPKIISKYEDIDYCPFYLDSENYVRSLFFTVGEEVINESSCYANLLRLHYYHVSKQLQSKADYNIFGFCGSEIFRAVHMIGSHISNELFHFFNSQDESWIYKILESWKWKILGKQIKNETSELIIDKLRRYKLKNINISSDNNRFLYKYIFEEVFRKIYGIQIYLILNNMSARTPFLDYEFINILFKTKYAGINNSFFTHNPVKRMKGQYVYAKIMQKTYPNMLNYATGRGYMPRDLLRYIGIINIIKHYYRRRKQKQIDLDNLGIISGLNNHVYLYNSRINESRLYSFSEIQNISNNIKYIDEKQRDIYALAASTSTFLCLNNGYNNE
jgi:hypothetical protein